MTRELFVTGGTPGLIEALTAYEGLAVSSVASLERLTGLLAGDAPPAAVYVDDSRGTAAELWALVRAAQARRIAVLLGLRGPAATRRQDFLDAGLAVTDTDDPVALAAWIAAQLGARRRSAATTPIVAIGSAKGGVGKTLVVSLLAEALAARGARVLIVDGDISNSGLIPTFRISGARSYLRLREDGAGAWTPANVRHYVFHHAPSGIDFLLSGEEAATLPDLTLEEWGYFMQAVRGLGGYDLILLDTGPEIRKRPYAILAARDGGWVVLPVPPGRKERSGAGNALRVFAQGFADRDLTERCLLLFMEPERGVVATIGQVAPLFAASFPRARVLGTLPRDPTLVSLADEDPDRYQAILDLAPHSALARATHAVVAELAQTIGLTLPLPMPRSSLWQRLRRRRPTRPIPPAAPVVGADAQEVG